MWEIDVQINIKRKDLVTALLLPFKVVQIQLQSPEFDLECSQSVGLVGLNNLQNNVRCLKLREKSVE